MKIFAISDLHLSVNNPKPMDIFGPAWDDYVENVFADWKEKVSDEDVVLMAGDFSWAMKLEEAVEDFNLLKDLPGKKIIIRGNHDFWWSSISAVRKILPKNFFAIQNDAIKIENSIFCGTRGWILPDENFSVENKKIFDREVLRLEMTLKKAQSLRENNEKVYCMMHYPPMYYKKDNLFSQLLEKYNVSKVIYGHLHAKKNPELFYVKNGIEYFLTSCDLVKHKLVLIDEV